MFSNLIRAGMILVSCTLLASLSQAQGGSGGGQQQQPVPPVSPVKTVGDQGGDSSADGNTQMIPDSHPVAGAQDLTLGSSESSRSFLLPSFTVLTQVGTDPFTSTSTSHPGILSTTFVSGRLGLNVISSRSEFLMDYIAGGSFSNDGSLGNSLIQGLNLTETIRGGRWSVLLGDQFSYLSTSPFGFGGVGGLNNLGVSLGNGVGSGPGISSGFATGQSIFLTGLDRINNTSLGQITYDLSRRSSLNFIGSDQLLDFFGSPLENSSVVSVQAGYTYLLSRLNSFSVLYRFDDFSFATLPQTIHQNTVQAVFARRITGRLAWQVGAGPAIHEYVNPLLGPSTVTSPTVFTTLTYKRRYTGFDFSYSHALSNGSGIYPGALSDTVTARLTRTFGKNWESSIDGGYARNQALQQTLPTAGGSSSNNWFVNARITRRFVGYGALFLSYNASGQSNLSAICPLQSCAYGSLVNTGSVGYTWGLRPIYIE
jgi:hypothetical protein